MIEKPQKICDSVYQVAGPEMTSGRDCCVYLVDGGAALALVDAGCTPDCSMIIANVIRLGFEPDDIASVLLTHCHIDHVGGAGCVRERAGADLVAHEAAAAPLEKGDRIMTAAFLYGVRFDPLEIDRRLSAEEEEVRVGERSLQVLYTPGHSPGSVSAYLDLEGIRVLFGQDIHGPFHPDFGSDIEAWRTSMNRLLALEADILCEGHFGVYSPARAVRSYIEGYLERFQR